MSTTTTYKNLSVLAPDPSASGGQLIQNNFKSIADTLEGKLALAGGTMTGDINMGGRQLVECGGITSDSGFAIAGGDVLEISAGGTSINLVDSVYFNSGLIISDGVNIFLDVTTGTKIGTATNQKLAFFNATPTVQPTAAATTTGFAASTGTTVVSGSTFTGGTGSTAYTIGDLVKALKALGLIAA